MTNLKAQKSFSQNFLTNKRVASKMIDACRIKKTDTVLEIGPGKGALTEHLVEQAKKVIAVEADKRMTQYLKSNILSDKLEIITASILNYSWEKLPLNCMVIGNLPYHISTPIIETIILNKKTIKNCFLTVQKEYADRMAAKHGSKTYGSLSCFLQYHASVKKLFSISPGSFSPPPKVTSSFIQLTFSNAKQKAKDEDLLFQIIRASFGQRRKTIQNSLKKTIERDVLLKVLEICKINPQCRAEEISLDQFIRLADLLTK